MATTRFSRGLTLVESVVTLAVFAIAAASAAPRLQGLLDARRLDGLATGLAADLQLARNEAIARDQPVRITAHATQACYVIHTGAAASCDCAGAGAATCTSGAQQIRTVHWNAADGIVVQANSASMVFDPLHGTASPTGSWRVISADGRAIHQIVNVMGRVRSCAGAGTVPGYRSC
jgi:type IV fimbrial biogenesis protein FimT